MSLRGTDMLHKKLNGERNSRNLTFSTHKGQLEVVSSVYRLTMAEETSGV